MTTATEAVESYNLLFDNQQYSTIAERLAVDLRCKRESARVSQGMNLITDTALSLVKHPHYEDAWLHLATFCGQNSVTIPTIDTIHRYLLIFQQPRDNRTGDFELTAKALLKIYESTDPLRAAVSCANGVHGWQGRAAYELLAAASFLSQAAAQLLMHGNPSYIGEKLQHALKRITNALHEGVRHSERPNFFDCSSTCFPAEQDRR